MALLLVYRYFLGNRLLAQSDKLRREINRIPKEVLEFSHEPTRAVTSAIGDIGIEGIMAELGIDPGILKNPLVKGLVDKYAPRVLEQLSKGNKGSGENHSQDGF